MLQLSWRGTALLSSCYGAIVRRSLPAGARCGVETGRVVAFDARMGYTLRRAARSGWIRRFMSGEPLVAEYTGPGDPWLQTRNLRALAGALSPLLPSRQQGRG